MPPYDYDYLIGAARSGDRRANLLLDYLAANKRVNSFINSGEYQYSPVIEEVAVNDTIDDNVEIDSGSADNIYKDISKSIGKQGGNTGWMNSAMGIASGAATMLSLAQQNASIADTSRQRGMIQDIRNTGMSGYNDISQIASDYNYMDSLQPDLSWDTIRGGSEKERIGNVFNSALSGFQAGMSTGNIYAALGLAAAGAGTAIGGWISGNKAADLERANLKLDNRLARSAGAANINAGVERLADNGFRMGTKMAEGGKIQRSETTMKDFADAVLKNTKANDSTHSSGIVREKVEGGTRIRIKR